jgi:hypothetical protein
MRGEPEFDLPPFLWNPADGGGEISLARTERRLAAFAGAGLDEERMRAWSVIRGPISGSTTRTSRCCARWSRTTQQEGAHAHGHIEAGSRIADVNPQPTNVGINSAPRPGNRLARRL